MKPKNKSRYSFILGNGTKKKLDVYAMKLPKILADGLTKVVCEANLELECPIVMREWDSQGISKSEQKLYCDFEVLYG